VCGADLAVSRRNAQAPRLHERRRRSACRHRCAGSFDANLVVLARLSGRLLSRRPGWVVGSGDGFDMPNREALAAHVDQSRGATIAKPWNFDRRAIVFGADMLK
jgi:hypothetical protein